MTTPLYDASYFDRLNALARRLACDCRQIIQACLREEEWRDADQEFYKIIRAGLVAITGTTRPDAKENCDAT